MDSKSIATKGLKRAFHLFLVDLNSLPAEAYDKCFGGAARTVADIVHEVNMVNDDVCSGLRGEEQIAWPEGWITAPENLRTKGAVIASLQKSSASAMETAESIAADQYDEPYIDNGAETTRFERVRFMTLHLWYHSGQLNFIQTLLGDDKFNWLSS